MTTSLLTMGLCASIAAAALTNSAFEQGLNGWTSTKQPSRPETNCGSTSPGYPKESTPTA